MNYRIPYSPDLKLQGAEMHQSLELQKTKKRKIAEESSFDGNDDDADVTVGASTRNTHISQVPKQSILTEFSTRRLTADQKWDIDDCLTKFIVTSGIPFQTLENYYFIEFLQKLCPSYDPPSRKQFVTKYLPRLHNQWWAGLTDSMVGRENMTLALDGWTTRADEYVYLFLALHEGSIQVLGLEDMSAESHTADNIVRAVEDCLKRLGLQMKQFDWIISGSPSVMVSARKKLAEAYPHLGTFGCTVHLVHNMVSAITKLAMVSDVLTNNSVLINIFNRSHIWDSRLKEFQIQRNIPGLCGYSKISMYSVYQSTASVLLNKEGIISLANHGETEISQEGLPKAVSNVIENSQHWADNEAVVALVKPFADAIEAIETRQFTLSETYLELLQLGEKIINSFSNALVDARYTNIKSKVLSIYNHYMATLDHDLCMVALFLHPPARKLAVSHKYKLDDIKLIAKGIVRRWRWPKPFMEKLMHQIVQYAHFIGPFGTEGNVPDDDPLVYWAYIDRMKANELVSFARRVLSLVPRSVEPDSIPSILAHYNTKGRNRLNVASLRILAQVKLWLLQKMKTVQKGVRSDSEFIANSTVDIVPGDEAGQLELEDWGESLESTALDEVKTEFMSLEMAAQEKNFIRFEENGDVPIGDTLVSGNLNVRKNYSTASQLLGIMEVAKDVDLGY